MSDPWAADRPIHLQVYERLVQGVLDGTWAEGQALPSVRALAAQLGLNPMTVLRALQTLTAQGGLVARRGLSPLVATGARARLMVQERERVLAEDVPRWRVTLERLGLDPAVVFER